MIKEAYCSNEVSELLKEKGFDELCIFYYKDGVLMINPFFKGRNSHQTDTYSAPTHQMAMAWLRQKYNIYISVQPDFPSDKDYKICWCWSASILDENCIILKGYQCYIETYEEATEAAIKYCLENLIII